MKHRYINILLPLVLSTAVSCSGFLDEINPTGLTNVMETEALLEANANGMYYSAFFNCDDYVEKFCAASGLWQYGGTGSTVCSQTRFTSSHFFTVYSDNASNDNAFSRANTAVRKANLLITNIKDSPVDETYKLEIEAEARFYRGVVLFFLVRNWGDIPLWTAPPTPQNATYCERVHFCQVYEQIIADLEYAEAHMRAPERVKAITPQQPRPNKYAATAYLSSVYVTIGSLLAHPDDNFWDETRADRVPDFSFCEVSSPDDAYKKALSYAEKLIPESENHDPGCQYALLEKFGDLFRHEPGFSRNGYDSWINPEQIFIYSNSVTSSNSLTFSRNTLPNYCPGTASESVTSTNYGRTRPNRFIFQKWCETYPGAFGTSSGLTEIYASSSDPRVNATFYCKRLVLGDGSVLDMYPLSASRSKAYGFPYLKKYWASDFVGYTSSANLCYMRLPEVYFNAAEAAAWLGDEPLARKYIEVIHKRARHSVEDGDEDAEQPTWEGRTFADKDELMTAIFWERTFELLGEGHEFMDSHRFGATWFAKNIARPLNDHIMRKEQASMFNGTWFAGEQRRIYVEDPVELRKSLIVTLPYSETSSNAAISSVANDFWWGI